MFNLIDVGERAGSGIPNIFSVWKKQGWSAPIIEESFEPDRITLSLLLKKSDDKKTTIKSDDKKATAKTAVHKGAIVSYLTENVSAKSSVIADLLGLKSTRVKEILVEMIDEGVLVSEGSNKNRIYKLKM
jgi:predicted HTH transcriptional regulator